MTIERFTLTENHVKLLKRMNVSWDNCEFGAPCIDPKRPYGNSSVLRDIAKILGLPPANDDTGEFPFTQETDMHSIHRDMQKVLQVVLCAQSFTPGVYESENWREWKLIKSHATREAT